MYKNKKILGVIPARGGSVGVPKKNIRLLDGKPLVVHTFEQAKQVPELDLITLSTDDDEIAEVGRTHNINVVKRPSELATAESRTESALIHALDVLGPEYSFDYVAILEPTSPFRRPETISKSIREIVDQDAPSLVTLCETRASLGTLNDGRFIRLDPDAPRRRQDRSALYYESSTLYLVSVEHLRFTNSVVADDWLGVEVSQHEAIDINTLLDFQIAEAICSRENFDK
jgi:CMP-N,N'-diacetyllegionaminic acid synthase